MALFCGDRKIRLNIGGYIANLKLSTTPIISNTKLLSSDNLYLKDSEDVYLTTKKEEG